jgi:hypothetical protein
VEKDHDKGLPKDANTEASEAVLCFRGYYFANYSFPNENMK